MGHRSLAGVRVHAARRLDSIRITEHRGIPVTTVAFTLLGLCAVMGDREALRCFDEAIRLGLTTPEALRALDDAGFANGHLGAPRWRRLLCELVPKLRSVHEARCFRAFVRGGLKAPEHDVPVDVAGTTYWLDMAYSEVMLAIEADSSHHAGAAAVDHDMLRERRLTGIGWHFEHFSRDEALRDPTGLAARVAARYIALAAAAGLSISPWRPAAARPRGSSIAPAARRTRARTPSPAPPGAARRTRAA
jgi:hypothetical protein